MNQNTREQHSNAELINRDSFERLRSKKYRRTFDEWVFILLVLLFLCVALFFICGLIFFRAKNVSVVGGSFYESEEILQESGITDKDNLFFIDQNELQDRLTLRFPYIYSVTLRRILPTTLIIEINEDTPAYYTEINGEAFLLSETLRVLARSDSISELPTNITELISVTLPPVTYAVVGRRLAFERESTYGYMLDFFNLLRQSEYSDSIDRISASSKFRINVFLGGNRYKVVFGSAEQAQDKLEFFKGIVEQKLKPTDFAVIDVSDTNRAFVSLRDGPIYD